MQDSDEASNLFELDESYSSPHHFLTDRNVGNQ